MVFLNRKRQVLFSDVYRLYEINEIIIVKNQSWEMITVCKRYNACDVSGNKYQFYMEFHSIVPELNPPFLWAFKLDISLLVPSSGRSYASSPLTPLHLFPPGTLGMALLNPFGPMLVEFIISICLSLLCFQLLCYIMKTRRMLYKIYDWSFL